MKNLIIKQRMLVLSIYIISFVFCNNKIYCQDIDTLEWEEIVDLADTVYNSGMDTIYVIEDSTSETTGFRTGASLDCATPASTMSINLNKTVKTINKGQFGVNVTGMFTKSTLYGDIYSEDQWQWLSDMRPKVLRFPGGSSSKFMHLLTGDKGYGYDIVEITRYLDAIDNDLEAPTNATDIMNETNVTTLLNWFGGSSEILDAFEEYRTDYGYQEDLTSGDRFIDHFIRLIQKIETDNQVFDPTYKVDVIVCLNILTETAEDCLDIVQYLQSNPIHNVNVVGVEMGNETANKFHKQIMQFDEFENYWQYLDGQAVVGQASKEAAIGESLFIPAANRNFFYVFRNRSGVNYKIGLCAEGLNGTGEVFNILPAEDAGSRSVDWNVALRSHYGDTHAGTSVKKFHAVILHTYFSADSWYNECVTETGILGSYSCPEWDFDNADTRIQPAFDAARLNFRKFMLTRFDNDLDLFNLDLNFNLTSSIKKDMWITEWNLKDEGTPNNGKIFTNSYQHTVLLQEWWLKNLKLNFTEGYRENFFKYATLQNYAGGSGVQMLTPADEDVELTLLGQDVSPYNLAAGDPAKRNYYVKRTVGYTMDLISEINKNNLNYFPATVATYGHNPNLPPTFFITPAKDFVYMYFTNSRCNDQRYVLNPAGMYLMYGYQVELVDAEMFVVDAFQAYSQSGKSMIYDFNSCYTPANPYDMEIDQTYNYVNPVCTAADGSLCITVPGFTSGYVKMAVVPYVPRMADEINTSLSIYPNPANNLINISSTEQIVSVAVISMTGAKMFETIDNCNIIDISMLSYGMYQVICTFSDGSNVTKSFIKL